MLKSKKIDGFVLDRFTLITFYDNYKNHSEHKPIVSFLQTATAHSEMSYRGETLSYGILVKHKQDYDFFIDFVRDNQQVINACNDLILNRGSVYERAQEDEENVLFSANGTLFWPTVIVGLAFICCIVCFGFVYEWRKKKERSFDCETIL